MNAEVNSFPLDGIDMRFLCWWWEIIYSSYLKMKMKILVFLTNMMGNCKP